MSSFLLERTRGIISRDRSSIIRAESDNLGNTLCLVASLAEVSASLGGAAPRLRSALESTRQNPKWRGEKIGNVNMGGVFQYLEQQAEVMGIRINRILGAEKVILAVPPTESLIPITHAVFGQTNTSFPNIVFMVSHDGDKCHAESNLGEERTFGRIKRLEKKGWMAGMVVEFEKIK